MKIKHSVIIVLTMTLVSAGIAIWYQFIRFNFPPSNITRISEFELPLIELGNDVAELSSESLPKKIQSTRQLFETSDPIVIAEFVDAIQIRETSEPCKCIHLNGFKLYSGNKLVSTFTNPHGSRIRLSSEEGDFILTGKSQEALATWKNKYVYKKW